MQINSSLDWSDVSTQLRKIGRSATQDPRLSKVLQNIHNDVKILANMEIEARRRRQLTSTIVQYQEMLTKINSNIEELEMLHMMAALYM